jgi:hypothetical protein
MSLALGRDKVYGRNWVWVGVGDELYIDYLFDI